MLTSENRLNLFILYEIFLPTRLCNRNFFRSSFSTLRRIHFDNNGRISLTSCYYYEAFDSLPCLSKILYAGSSSYWSIVVLNIGRTIGTNGWETQLLGRDCFWRTTMVVEEGWTELWILELSCDLSDTTVRRSLPPVPCASCCRIEALDRTQRKRPSPLEVRHVTKKSEISLILVSQSRITCFFSPVFSERPLGECISIICYWDKRGYSSGSSFTSCTHWKHRKQADFSSFIVISHWSKRTHGM